MTALGEVAREQARTTGPEELARPFDDAELDRLAAGVASALPEKPRVPRRRAVWGAAAGVVLAAAAAFLLLARSTPPSGALPAYELVLEGATRVERGAGESTTGDVALVERGGHLTLVVRPAEPTHEASSIAVWIAGPDGSLAAPSMTVRRSEEGAFRIDAPASALAALPAGRCQLVVFVGAKASLPSDSAAAARALTANDGHVQVLLRTLDVAP